MREMSPKQFFDQVGGTSYDSVRRHFVKLVEFGWLRRVRTESRGRGRPEHLYRSTELAVIDDETWAELPISIRDAFTVQLLEEMGERLATSVTAGTFESKKDSVLSFALLLLDEPGWAQAIQAMNACFRTLSQEQIDAKVRLEKSQKQPILMIVELGGFEAAEHLGDSAVVLPPSPGLGALPWPQRLAKVFGDPLNLAVIDLLNRSPMSATELHAALGGPSPESFDRRCKTLTRLGWLAKVDTLTGGFRRGATENFYRATSPHVSAAEILNRVPGTAKKYSDWGAFERFCECAVSAVRAGTFNAQKDRHLTLCTLLVDELGWTQVVASLRSCSKTLIRIGAEARHRSAATEMKEVRRTGFFIAGFASPLEKEEGLRREHSI